MGYSVALRSEDHCRPRDRRATPEYDKTVPDDKELLSDLRPLFWESTNTAHYLGLTP